MSTTTQSSATVRGGAFVIEDTTSDAIFTPEDFNEEQLMVRDMVHDFLITRIQPMEDRIERQEFEVVVQLLGEMGELGLLGTHMPEEYGGMAMATNTNTLICDTLGPAGTFTVSYAAHTGIGMLPILYFGTEEQKKKYLPRLISGELKASYCLTEPGSGSDALAAKTRADLTEDGQQYVINGQKMWITNAGFADIYIVFAQVGGDQFTGFIVERDSEGLTLGAEEKKLGIKGSSTRQVFFENVVVHKDQVLGEIGKGHLIAFNALNNGRFKLCALSMGGAKRLTSVSTQYAIERKQFGRQIADFGAIQYKLSEQAIRCFAVTSALYRVSGMMEEKKAALMAEGMDSAAAKLQAAEEYAIECALLKFQGSEVLDYVVDECLQIHGGMGYSEEGIPAKSYRDARINRIYEGTNEINRLLSVDMLFKRAMSGSMDVATPAMAIHQALAQKQEFPTPDGPLGPEIRAVQQLKRLFLYTAGIAVQQQMAGAANLKRDQMVVMNLSDILSEVLQADSMLLRVQKILTKSQAPAPREIYEQMLQLFINEATQRAYKSAQEAIASLTTDKMRSAMLKGIQQLADYPPVDQQTLRRKIAAYMVAQGGYTFS